MLITTSKDIWIPDTRQSVYIVGYSNAGKTSLLFNVIQTLLQQENQGLAVIDTHDLAPSVLQVIPKARFRDVIWMDASEGNIALNLVDYAPGKDLTHTLDAFQSIYHFKPDAYRLLRHALAVHSYVKQSDISGVLKMLQSGDYRRDILKWCKDDLAWRYWKDEYSMLHNTPRLLADAQNPVKGAIEDILSRASLKKMFCVPKSRVSFKEIMDRGQVLVCSVPKTIGDRNAAIVQAFILALCRSAAFTRETQNSFPIFLDEFQTVASPEIIDSMLSELRKWGVSLVMAHQGQNDEMIKTVLRNAWTKICWRPTGEALKEEFAGFDFMRMNEEAKRLGYRNGCAVRVGTEEFVGFPIERQVPDIATRLKEYAKPDRVKRHSKLRYCGTKK